MASEDDAKPAFEFKDPFWDSFEQNRARENAQSGAKAGARQAHAHAASGAAPKSSRFQGFKDWFNARKTSQQADDDLNLFAQKPAPAAKTATNTEPKGPGIISNTMDFFKDHPRIRKGSFLLVAPTVAVPLYGVPWLWQRRGSALSRLPSFKQAIGWGFMGGASLIVLGALADRHEHKSDLTDGLVHNALYTGNKGLEHAGRFSSEKAVPCVNDLERCAKNALGAGGQMLVNGSVTAARWTGSTWLDLTKGYYNGAYNLLTGQTGSGRAYASSGPGVLQDWKNTGPAAKTPNMASMFVVVCRKDYSNGELRNASPENWDLMKAFAATVEDKIRTEKHDPRTPLGAALAEARTTGDDVVIEVPYHETFIEAYREATDGHDRPMSIKAFNEQVRSIDPRDDDALNLKVSLQKKGKCPTDAGHTWMPASHLTVSQYSDFVKK